MLVKNKKKGFKTRKRIFQEGGAVGISSYANPMLYPKQPYIPVNFSPLGINDILSSINEEQPPQFIDPAPLLKEINKNSYPASFEALQEKINSKVSSINKIIGENPNAINTPEVRKMIQEIQALPYDPDMNHKTIEYEAGRTKEKFVSDNSLQDNWAIVNDEQGNPIFTNRKNADVLDYLYRGKKEIESDSEKSAWLGWKNGRTHVNENFNPIKADASQFVEDAQNFAKIVKEDRNSSTSINSALKTIGGENFVALLDVSSRDKNKIATNARQITNAISFLNNKNWKTALKPESIAAVYQLVAEDIKGKTVGDVMGQFFISRINATMAAPNEAQAKLENDFKEGKITKEQKENGLAKIEEMKKNAPLIAQEIQKEFESIAQNPDLMNSNFNDFRFAIGKELPNQRANAKENNEAIARMSGVLSKIGGNISDTNAVQKAYQYGTAFLEDMLNQRALNDKEAIVSLYKYYRQDAEQGINVSPTTVVNNSMGGGGGNENALEAIKNYKMDVLADPMTLKAVLGNVEGDLFTQFARNEYEDPNVPSKITGYRLMNASIPIPDNDDNTSASFRKGEQANKINLFGKSEAIRNRRFFMDKQNNNVQGIGDLLQFSGNTNAKLVGEEPFHKVVTSVRVHGINGSDSKLIDIQKKMTKGDSLTPEEADYLKQRERQGVKFDIRTKYFRKFKLYIPSDEAGEENRNSFAKDLYNGSAFKVSKNQIEKAKSTINLSDYTQVPKKRDDEDVAIVKDANGYLADVWMEDTENPISLQDYLGQKVKANEKLAVQQNINVGQKRKEGGTIGKNSMFITLK